jgi:hypothetical protein
LGNKFKSSHPDESKNKKTSKACKSNDLQAFLFLQSQNKPFKTVVNVNKTVSSYFLYSRGHQASCNTLFGVVGKNNIIL